MNRTKIFRFTLALMLVVLAVGAAWAAGSRNGIGSLQPTVEAAQAIVIKGQLAWDCPGCPP
ncbi:MAG: hypothetical protein VB013_13825 [Anaerolineaceae bacterium]|nr:hypothetical protein [Anaerolineaceae bacterium]